MFLRSIIFRSLGIAALVAALSLVLFADTLHLKDGSIIKGKIVSFTGGKFTVVIGEGAHRHELTFASNEVESIKFDDDSNVAATEPTRRFDPKQPVQQQPVQRQPVQQQQPVKQQQSQSTPVQQNDQKPRFRQWDAGQKPTVVVTDNNRSSQPVSQKPTTVPPAQNQPRVIPASGASTQPGRVDPVKQNSGGAMQPIAWDVKVTADNTNNGWTNSGWVVRKGQKIHITADGEISLGGGNKTSASGSYTINDDSKLMKSVPTGALIAVIGDDNNDFIYVGSEREFTATRDGALFLGVNEGNLNDNSGTFDVKIEISQ